MNIPRTEAQIEASPANGALSHGPVTEHGKAVAARHSVRHGLLGNTILLPGESAEAFELLYLSHLEEFAPQTASEFEILDAMVVARWREMRIIVIHTGKQAVEILRQQQNAPGVAAHAMPFRAWTAFHDTVSAGIAEPLLGRYETRFHRQ
jgi:hypothetical protein